MCNFLKTRKVFRPCFCRGLSDKDINSLMLLESLNNYVNCEGRSKPVCKNTENVVRSCVCECLDETFGYAVVRMWELYMNIQDVESANLPSQAMGT